MTAQLSLPVCVLPGCGTPVGEWGDACRTCITAFDGFLQHNPGGQRLTEAEIAARDSDTRRAYALQREAS